MRKMYPKEIEIINRDKVKVLQLKSTVSEMRN